MIGFDTGFFLKLWAGNQHTREVWEEIENNNRQGVISVITLYELRKIGLKKVIRIDFEKAKEMITEILSVIQITPEIADKSAFLSHGTGIHMADAIILTSLLEAGCKEVYTDNISHLGEYKKKDIKIIQI